MLDCRRVGGRHCRDAAPALGERGNCSVFIFDQKPLKAKSSTDGQVTQSQHIQANLSRHFAPKLLLKKVLSSTLIKIRQNLKMNAMLEIAYITNLFLIGTINKNTY